MSILKNLDFDRRIAQSSGSPPLAEMDEHFLVEIYDSTDVPSDVFELRRSIFCDQMQVLNAATEHDAYDEQALHVVVRERASGKVIGTTRVIPSDPALPGRGLSMAHYCTPDLIDGLPERVGEVSRFVLATHQHLLRVTLLRGIVAASALLGLTHWCVTAEPSLLQLMERTGATFTPIGPLVNSAERMRQPALAEIAATLAEAERHYESVYRFVTQPVARLPSA